MATTLVLTRKPNNLFESTANTGQHGRFGTLVVLSGSRVKAVQVLPSAGARGGAAISVPGGTLDVTTLDGGKVAELNRYTTIERMDGIIQLAPQEHIGSNKDDTYKGALCTGLDPSGCLLSRINSAVLELKAGLKKYPHLAARANGNCFRVLGDCAPGSGQSSFTRRRTLVG
jgi:hypothetical protein